eukprot:CAMPEP_0184695386 /NCGR_PEP_ID=MMETSP0313-20130426/3029_1 /TAXON_ID=2792 /ORGANISM="Porphyridium aerugineum, Strain SAG 1380-2" /LENGTH=408 /DNA_ID=CAMNT_0027153823 /DNA_START=128 /DNA_END=1354 /DNA_ORIENTATION=+
MADSKPSEPLPSGTAPPTSQQEQPNGEFGDKNDNDIDALEAGRGDSDTDPKTKCCCPACGTRKNKKKKKNADDKPDNVDANGNLIPEATKCYKFRQQELYAITPILSPPFVITMYFVMSCVCIPLGAVMIADNNKLKSSPTIRYDNIPACDVGNNFTSTKTCQVSFALDQPIPAPSYFYYQLTNYYQNARTYALSRSSAQLMGEWPLTSAQIDTCEPILDNKSNGEPVPCGLTAWSYFNDTFVLCKDQNCADGVNVTQNGIAWPSDVEYKFKPGPIEEGSPWTEQDNDLITSEPFMVWMRLSSFNQFNKLFMIVQEDLPAGTYYVNIQSNYPVSSFDGQKAIVLYQVTWYGGKNEFLAIAYTVTGCVCFVLACVFLIRHLTKPRKAAYEDPSMVLDRINEIANEDAKS